ncbi:MAG: acetyl-CoA carboxylase, carboxyltransferase subunit beta [Rhodobacteraceae bacterium]|nr:acetyl-CoA carboxylase, carboxyltransferase subunit beta [Paracoccaceae bacterium]
MNWISNYVRPKLKSILKRKEVPEHLWTTCPECAAMLNHRSIDRALYVCPECDHHMAIPPRKRFDHLFDNQIYELVDVPLPREDPLHFRDSKRYPDRLREARKTTKEHEAMLVAIGNIGKTRMVVAAQDFRFMAGSMGIFVGNAIVAACKLCRKEDMPLILFATAGGARMQEGILSLMQMPRTTVAVQSLAEAGLPYIVVLTHPTTGGVTASFAMLGDIHMAEPGALIGFAGPRVIEQTIKEQLPEGFQRAEHLLKNGMLDMVVHRAKIRERIISIVRMLSGLPPPIRGSITYRQRKLPAPVDSAGL